MTTENGDRATAQRTTAKAVAGRVLVHLGDVVGAYCVLRAIALAGDFAIGRSFQPGPLAPVAMAWLLAFLAGRRLTRLTGTRPRHRGWIAAAGTFGLLAGLTLQVSSDLQARWAFPDGLDVAVHAPGDTVIDCIVHEGCGEHVMDDAGFRNGTAGRPSADRRVVAVVGDSFVYGSGVDDPQTLAARLEDDLATSGTGPVAVRSAGIEGTNLLSHPGLAAWATRAWPTAVVVSFFQVPDLDPEDIHSRLRRLRDSFVVRWVAAAGYDALVEGMRLAWQRRQAGPEGVGGLTREQVEGALDRLLAASGAARLLLVTRLPGTPGEWIAGWVAGHPRTGWLDASRCAAWDGVRTLGDGVHWNAAGTRIVAGILAGPIARALAVTGDEPLGELHSSSCAGETGG